MWSSDRRGFLSGVLGLAGAATLAGCGFTPAYGPQGGAAKLLGGITPDAPKTRDGFDFTQALISRLGPPDPARYRFAYTISTKAIGQGITPDNTTTRYQLNGSIDYTLHDAGTDAVLLTGRVTSFTSWSASGTVVATQVAEQDAHRRLMVILADQIVTRLLAQAASLPE